MWLAYWQGSSGPHLWLLLAKYKIQGSSRFQNCPGPRGETSRYLLRHAPLCTGGTHLWVTSSEQQAQTLTRRVKTQTCMSVPCYWIWMLSHVRLRASHSEKFNSCLLVWKNKTKHTNGTPHTFRSPDDGTHGLRAAGMSVAACSEDGPQWYNPGSIQHPLFLSLFMLPAVLWSISQIQQKIVYKWENAGQQRLF